MDNRVQRIDKRGLIRQLVEKIDCHHGRSSKSARGYDFLKLGCGKPFVRRIFAYMFGTIFAGGGGGELIQRQKRRILKIRAVQIVTDIISTDTATANPAEIQVAIIVNPPILIPVLLQKSPDRTANRQNASNRVVYPARGALIISK